MIDSIDAGLDSTLTLGEWLESEEAKNSQRYLEDKIMNMLFSQDPESIPFQKMVIQLARVGARPESSLLLEREIAALNDSDDCFVEQCGLRKGLKKVGKFISDHRTEILIGVAVVATGTVIAVAAGYTLTAVVGGVAVAGAGSVLDFEINTPKKIPLPPLPDPKACSKEELTLLQTPFSTPLPKIALPSSPDGFLVTENGVWANGQFFNTHQFYQNPPSLAQNYLSPMNDWRSFAHISYSSRNESDTPSYETRGKTALALGQYNEAIQNLGKAIELDPTNPTSYLERGAALLNLGEYDASLEDYQQFTSQAPTAIPLSLSEFTTGLAKGLPKGVYESGHGALLFLVDFVNHPIQTSRQMIDSITTLASLVRHDEWSIIAEALSPEAYRLVTEWDTLTSTQRGELAGYTIGKHGADILAPGALAKVASKSIRSAEELASLCKNLQIAQETLLLETAAGIGNGAKVAEIIEAGQTTARLADELGFTAREMGQLKQNGQLEVATKNRLECLSPQMQESTVLFNKAEAFLGPHSKSFLSETQIRDLIHQTGIRTFPRPAGIPENYIVRITDKGAGMEYTHPTNTHLSVRVMPGKPHSPYPNQQKPYVIQKKDGKAFDKDGNLIGQKAPEAHIPLEEFIYRD